MTGIIIIDKPEGITSFDAVAKARRICGEKKCGHSGTLDPMATGVMTLLFGGATGFLNYLPSHDKEYIADVGFGATTPSYDLEKEVDRTFPYDHVTEEAVRAALPAFLGTQEQVAPLFSAKSVDGVRAYELARKMYRKAQRGESDPDFDAAALDTLHTSTITISDIELLSFIPARASASGVGQNFFDLFSGKKILVRGGSADADNADGTASSRIHVADTSALGLPHARIRIACSKGTYIRAFARDLGEALGTGAHLGGLVRTKTGAFRVEDALSLEEALALLAAD